MNWKNQIVDGNPFASTTMIAMLSPAREEEQAGQAGQAGQAAENS